MNQKREPEPEWIIYVRPQRTCSYEQFLKDRAAGKYNYRMRDTRKQPQQAAPSAPLPKAASKRQLKLRDSAA